MNIYIVDNKIYIIYKDKVFKYNFKSIYKGYIINKDEFTLEFLKVLKKEKIKALKVIILFNTYFKESDKYYIQSIMEEVGFLKITFKDIRDFFFKDAIYIELNNTYMVINLDKGIYLDLDYFKDIPKIIEYFKIDKDIILFGCNKIIEKVEVKDKNIYYLQNKEEFIVQSLLKYDG